eukprot:1179995-Pleurochrysis_carterae.AAC.1
MRTFRQRIKTLARRHRLVRALSSGVRNQRLPRPSGIGGAPVKFRLQLVVTLQFGPQEHPWPRAGLAELRTFLPSRAQRRVSSDWCVVPVLATEATAARGAVHKTNELYLRWWSTSDTQHLCAALLEKYASSSHASRESVSMVGLDHVGPQFKPLAQGVDSFVEASSDLPVIADAVVTPSFDASAPRLSPPHTPESPAKRPPWLSPGASGSAAGGLAAKAAQVTLRPERSEGAESTRAQALSARPATTHETREGVLRAKDAEKGTFSDRTRLCRGGSDCDNVSKGGVGTAPQKRPIECCTTELSAPGHETRASQGMRCFP